MEKVKLPVMVYVIAKSETNIIDATVWASVATAQQNQQNATGFPCAVGEYIQRPITCNNCKKFVPELSSVTLSMHRICLNGLEDIPQDGSGWCCKAIQDPTRT